MTTCDASAEPHVHRLQNLYIGGDCQLDNLVVVCATCHAALEYVETTEVFRCQACRRPMASGNAGCLPFFENGSGALVRRRKHGGPGACHDCGVAPGAYHHDGCDLEVCPTCGEQLLEEWHHEACDWQYVVAGPAERDAR